MVVVFYGFTPEIKADYWRRSSCEWAGHLECSTGTHNMLFKFFFFKKSMISIFTNMKIWYKLSVKCWNWTASMLGLLYQCCFCSSIHAAPSGKSVLLQLVQGIGLYT